MKLLKALGNPVALVVEGFLAGALVFVAANPAVLHPGAADASARTDAIVQELTR
ncbi:MAG TPA: hypothetical protein VGD66_04570 [Allosphingosinicella sp.]|jgi:hypothetical protein